MSKKTWIAYFVVCALIGASFGLALASPAKTKDSDSFAVVQQFQLAMQNGNFGAACSLYSDKLLGFKQSAYDKAVVKFEAAKADNIPNNAIKPAQRVSDLSRTKAIQDCARGFVGAVAFNTILAGADPLYLGSLTTDPARSYQGKHNVLTYDALFYGTPLHVQVQRDSDGHYKIVHIGD